MSEMVGRLPALIEMRKKHLVQLRANQLDPIKDKDGSASRSLAGTLRFLGVAEYIVSGNVQAFRALLSEAASLRIKMFERFEAGEPVSPSYVSMLSYKVLFDALAAGNWQSAKKLAAHMGGRDAVEQEYDHEFDRALGYVLKSFALDDALTMRNWFDQLRLLCKKKENADFSGYVSVFEALLAKDAREAQTGLAQVAEGHKRLARSIFKGTEDEMLCVWGVGLANLARSRNLPVESPDPLIPADLLP